jgi:hypothetical protein
LIPRVIGGGQARGVPNGTVDIDRFSAGATDNVVVIVPNTILVERRRSGGLDAPNDTFLGQDSEGVVHRLTRNGPDLTANILGDVVSRGVRPIRYRP